MGVKRPPPDGKMLRKYVENNDHEGIRCELDKGADINEIDPINKQSALLWCILHCSLAKVETIKFLIENGADVNIKYENVILLKKILDYHKLLEYNIFFRSILIAKSR